MNLKIVKIVVLLTLIACDSQDGPSRYESTLSSEGSEDYVSDADLQIGQIEGTRVDPKDLGVFRVAVALREGKNMPLIEYTASGRAEYVEMEVCSQESGACKKQKLLHNSRQISPLSFGRHTIKLQACVSKKFSVKNRKGCSDPSYTHFDYSSKAWEKANRLYQKKAELELSLVNDAEEGRRTLQSALKELKQCEKDAKKQKKASYWKIGIAGALALGDLLLDKAIIKGAGAKDKAKAAKNLTNGPEAPVSKNSMEKPVVSFAHGTNGLGAAGPSIDKMNKQMKKKGYFKNQSVPALATIGGAIFDLFKADDLVAMPCIAGQKYQNKMGALENAMENTKQELFLVEGEILEALGELQ